MNYFINPPKQAQISGVPEKEILKTFAGLLDIIEYSHLICSSEDVTEQQIKHNVNLLRQTVDTEFVKFDASVFTENVDEPNDTQITRQFEMYKKFLPGHPNESNPYGFGYMLNDRVALQYIVVSLEDIERIIEKPTQQQALDFYQNNRERFTQNIPSDPNDPNSTLTTRIQTYPEVAAVILEKLKFDRIDSKVNEILQKAKSLTEAAFEADSDSEKITAEPQLFENIGPLKDISANIRALVRIVRAEKAATPENINLTFSTETLSLDETQNQEDRNLYSVRKTVSEDLKNLAAMKIAEQKADEFIALAAETDWQNAVNKFNQLYPKPDSSEGEPNNFSLITLTDLPRMTNMQLKVFTANAAGNPGLQPFLLNLQRQSWLIEKLYSLVPSDANSLPTPAPPVELKSQMTYYCIKKLAVDRIDQSIYVAEKATRMYEEDVARAQSIAVVHFNPEYIIERMNYTQAGSRPKPPQDANQPAETEASNL